MAIPFKEAEPAAGIRTLEDLGLKVDLTSGKMEPTRPEGLAHFHKIQKISKVSDSGRNLVYAGLFMKSNSLSRMEKSSGHISLPISLSVNLHEPLLSAVKLVFQSLLTRLCA